MPPCKGRLAIIVLPDAAKTPIGFKQRPEDKKPVLFSAPKACGGAALSDAEGVGAEPLCAACAEREVKTAAAVAKAGGKYVANQQTLLHGRFGEPLPPWSHMFGSTWFLQTQAEKKLEIPEAIAAAIAAILPVDSAGAPVEMPPKRKVAGEPTGEPTAQTVEAATAPKKRAPKKVGAPATQAATPAPTLERKFVPKKKSAPAAALAPTLGVIQPQRLTDVEVVKVSVRKITIDDRTVYLSAEKDKVYDLKFNYIGRYNRRDDRIESKYADSDRE